MRHTDTGCQSRYSNWHGGIKTDAAMDAMREAGPGRGRRRSTAVREAAAVGVSLLELDEVGPRRSCARPGAGSPFLGYRPSFAPTPFPAVICTSVNDAIVHGIPTTTGCATATWSASTAAPNWAAGPATRRSASSWAGPAPPTCGSSRPPSAPWRRASRRPSSATASATSPTPSARCAARPGYGIPDGFGGHGIGRRMHEDPPVPNEGRPGRGLPLRHGMVLAIEPMLIGRRRGRATTRPPDGWTLRTNDGSRAAHAEHTVAITDAGPRVLTAR